METLRKQRYTDRHILIPKTRHTSIISLRFRLDPVDNGHRGRLDNLHLFNILDVVPNKLLLVLHIAADF